MTMVTKPASKKKPLPALQMIVRDIKQFRRNAGHVDLESLPPLEEVEPHLPSPDMPPVDLPPIHDVPLKFPTSEIPSSPCITHQQATVSSIGIKRGEPVTCTRFAQSSRSSSLLPPSDGSSSSKDEDNILMEDYDDHRSVNKRIAEICNEKEYRRWLTHEYNASLILPLWNPCPIDLGAVGYLSEPEGRFITLFNAFSPQNSDHGMVRNLPSINRYGQVKHGSQKLDKRSRLQKLDAITGPFAGLSRGVSQKVSRRYTYPLKAGHGIAIMCAETTEYRYLEPLDVPKKWFQSNVNSVMNAYGTQRHIQKEDLFLVVGTLCAPKYALFVSHSHPDGHAQFTVYSSPKTGQKWGVFTTDPEVTQEGSGPRQPASKVSDQQKGPWNSVLLARLRFKPDYLKPTSK